MPTHSPLFSSSVVLTFPPQHAHTQHTHNTHTPLVASGCLFPKQDGCCNTRRRRKKHVAKGRHGFKQKKRQKDRREHSWLCLEQQTTRAHKKVKTYAHTYTHAARTYTPHTHRTHTHTHTQQQQQQPSCRGDPCHSKAAEHAPKKKDKLQPRFHSPFFLGGGAFGLENACAWHVPSGSGRGRPLPFVSSFFFLQAEEEQFTDWSSCPNVEFSPSLHLAM